MKRNRISVPIAGAMLLAASAVPAQTQAFPTSPPADLPTRPFVLPKIESRTLPNGLKVVVAESRRVPLVTLRLAIRAGSLREPRDQPGLAEATASQLTAGADKYNSLQIGQTAEQLGGSIGVGAGDDYATLSGSALAENAGKLIDLAADVLLHPTFPEQELAIYKSRSLQGLVAQQQNPTFLAQRQFAKALYGDHPYGVVSSTPDAIKSLTRDRLLDFYKAAYTPQNAVLVVVGDVKASDVFASVEKALGGWTGSAPTNADLPALPSPDARKVYLVDRPGSVQSNILIGNLAIKRDDPDFFPLTVGNAILGGSPYARLFANVREKHGYAYSVSSGIAPRQLAGNFLEGAQTRTNVTAPALQEMLNEADRLRTEPVGADELQSVKNYLNGSFVLGLTSQVGLVDRLLTKEVFGLPDDYLATFRDKIDAVTPADVQRVAQAYIHPDKFAVVIVGDADSLRDDLKPFGNVEEK